MQRLSDFRARFEVTGSTGAPTCSARWSSGSGRHWAGCEPILRRRVPAEVDDELRRAKDHLEGRHGGVEMDRWLPRVRVAHPARAGGDRASRRDQPAAREVTGREMPGLRLLMTARQLPARLRGTAVLGRIDPDRRAAEAMAALGFVVLDEARTALTAGFVGRPWQLSMRSAVVRGLDAAGFAAFDRPGFIKAVTGTWVEPDGAGSRIVIETLVHATDDAAAHRFRPYWTLIEAFSGATRRDIVGAIARRALARRTRIPLEQG